MSTDPTAIAIQWDPRERRMRGRAVHGDTPFDVPYISHIEGNLWTGGCQSGLQLPADFVHVISLYPWESYEFIGTPRTVTQVMFYDAEPEEGLLLGLQEWATSCVLDGKTLIHCQAGLNRSGLLAALVLKKLGRSTDEAITLLRERRSPAVLCNPHFVEFLGEV